MNPQDSIVPKFTFEKLNWQMHGSMLQEYEMLENGRELFSIHAESLEWGFLPVLKISDSVDELLALGVTMTISFVTNATENGEPTTHL